MITKQVNALERQDHTQFICFREASVGVSYESEKYRFSSSGCWLSLIKLSPVGWRVRAKISSCILSRLYSTFALTSCPIFTIVSQSSQKALVSRSTLLVMFVVLFFKQHVGAHSACFLLLFSHETREHLWKAK